MAGIITSCVDICLSSSPRWSPARSPCSLRPAPKRPPIPHSPRPPASRPALLQPAGYYGGYHHKKSYDDYEPEEYEDGDDDEYKHKHKHKHEHKHHGCGGGYKQKYVCEHAEPRCFKQRECVWYYGREYCRYVRKCTGGEKYCKWISVPSYGSCY